MTKLTDFIHALAKLIKSVGTIFGFFAALYIAAVNFAGESKLGEWFGKVGDPLIAKERFSEGYLYYEVAVGGGLTPFGQLLVVPERSVPSFESLKSGYKLQAQSSVYLRPEPTTKKPFVRVHGEGQCFNVVEKSIEISGQALGNASSGGWLAVVESECPE